MLTQDSRRLLSSPFEDFSGFGSGLRTPALSLSLDIEAQIERLSLQVVTTTLRENPNLAWHRFEQAIATSSEYLMGALFMNRFPRTISVFGASKVDADSPAYYSAGAFARAIADKSDYFIMNGGGPGIMEASSKGAGRERCLGAALKLPHETGPNQYISEERLLRFKSFPPRIATLSFSDGLVMAEGGLGTLEEGFKIIDLVVKGNIAPKAVAWLGQEYWTKALDPLLSFLRDKSLISDNAIDEVFRKRFDDPQQLATHMLGLLPDIERSKSNWHDPNQFFDIKSGDITTPFPVLDNHDFDLSADGKGVLNRVQQKVYEEIARVSRGHDELLDKSLVVAFFKDFLDAVFLDAMLDSKIVKDDPVILILGDTRSPEFQRQLDLAKAAEKTVLTKSDFRGDKNGIALRKRSGAGYFGYNLPVRFKYTSLLAFAMHADDIVVCPGGTGTCAALYQMLTWKQTKQEGGRMSRKPVCFIDRDWYEASFRAPLAAMKVRGFADKFPGDDDYNLGRLINSVTDLW